MRYARTIAFGIAAVAFLNGGCAAQQPTYSSRLMPDDKEWTTVNIDVEVEGSSCYEGVEQHCRRYGRLYTWSAARDGCQSLGDGWRLPTDEEWRQLARHYGGVREDSADSGSTAYTALSSGGTSGFDALLGGTFTPEDAKYSRREEHGFYWSASETSPGTAWFYNFGKNGASLNRHREGAKQMAASVRCVKAGESLSQR